MLGARIALIALLALASLGAAPVRNARADDADDALLPQVCALLAGVRATDEASAALAVRLAGLGPGIVPSAFWILRDGRLPSPGGARPEVLGEAQRAVLLAALERLGRQHVSRFLRTSALQGSVSDRAAGLRILAVLGDASDLPLALELASREALPLHPLVSSSFQLALQELLQRDPAAMETLDARWFSMPGSVRSTALRALGVVGGPESLALLLGLLRWPDAPAEELLVQIERVAAELVFPPSELPSGRLIGLVESADPRLRARAAACLGYLDVPEATRALLALLDDPVAEVSASALDALRRTSGQRFPPDAARWRAWHASEEEWLARGHRAALTRLRSNDIADVVAGVRELTQHRLRRSDRARELAELLAAARPDVRSLACAALAQLGSPATLFELIEALDDPDAGVALAARAALRATTGVDLGEQSQTWRARYSGRLR